MVFFKSFFFFVEENICDEINKIVDDENHLWNKGLLNVNAKTSNWDGLRYSPIKKLTELCVSDVLPYISKINNFSYSNWYTESAWINFYQTGDNSTIHHHFFNDFCAILITKCSENCLKFYSPMHIHGYKKPFETDNLIEKINEKKGLFIFFPSYIYHSVSRCEKDRVSVAFNFVNQRLENI